MSYDLTDITETDEAVIIKVPVTVKTFFEVSITVAKNTKDIESVTDAIVDWMSWNFDVDEMADGNYTISCDDYEWEPVGSDWEYDINTVAENVAQALLTNITESEE